MRTLIVIGVVVSRKYYGLLLLPRVNLSHGNFSPRVQKTKISFDYLQK